MRSLLFALLAACSDADGRAPEGPRSQAPPGFWEHWGDGQAELDGYRLTTTRYKEPRTGEAVLVFVTETFTDAQRVKSDGGHDDEYPVMKLNDVRHFQTGIYDYDLMTSVFVRLDGGQAQGVPAKVSFSSQEWCGNIFSQILPGPKSWRLTSHSYFDGEGDKDEEFPLPPGLIFEDTLPILVRGLAGEVVSGDTPRELQAVLPLAASRLRHVPPAPRAGVLSMDPQVHAVTVPEGTHDARAFVWKTAEESTTWEVEVAPPHRILSWRREGPGAEVEEAVLTGTLRSQYWKQNYVGGEAFRRDLGLDVISSRPPQETP